MGRIHTLSPEEAQKIAAGEVVERPASVVKELLENALDADSDYISIIIDDGGRARIRVIDNGHGMDVEDMYACIKPHATSKVSQCADVPHVGSFGFRGEALSSISNVSIVTITSQQQTQYEGHTLVVSGGEIQDRYVTARSPGTDITIDHLFYNVPARKKFLKRRETEWRAIYQVCLACAISRPTCSFSLTHEGKRVFHCPKAESYHERLSQLHEASFTQQFLPCEYHDTQHDISITGLITRPTYHRYDRTLLTTFVNQRWVKQHRLAQSIIKGYAGILPERRFPAAFLFLTLPAEAVDINVHPRKEEVQFLSPRRIERAIEHAVRISLEAHTHETITASQQSSPHIATTTRPTIPTGSPRELMTSDDTLAQATHHTILHTENTPHTPKENDHSHPEIHTEMKEPTTPDRSERHKEHSNHATTYSATTEHNADAYAQDKREQTPDQQHKQHAIIPDHAQHQQTSDQQRASYTILGHIHATYIVLQTQEGCALIDQHAAHERVLYDMYIQRDNIVTSSLAFPYRINSNQDDVTRIMRHTKLLNSCGIEVDQLDTQTLLIRRVPIALTTIDWQGMIQHLLHILPEDETHNADEISQHVFHNICATMACKAAVKAGDTLSHTEMQEIIRQLYATPHPMTCPHGRPTLVTFSQSELSRMFHR